MTDERDQDSFLVDRDLRAPGPAPDASLADRERTFLLGLGLVSGGFVLAEGLRSITFAPIALIFPGLVLTLVGLLSLFGGRDQ